MAKGLAEARNITVPAAYGGSQPTEDQGRATGYGSLTQKLGSSPSTMLDFLGGLEHMNDNFSEVCFHGCFKSPCDCRAAERGCPDLPCHYIKASICAALHCIKKEKRRPVFRQISELNQPIRWPCSR